MTPPKKPAPGLSSQIEKAAMRQGISAWLQQLAAAKQLQRVTSREELLAFLGDQQDVVLTVLLKKGLRSATGVVLLSGFSPEGFALSLPGAKGPTQRTFKYAEVSLYFIPSLQKVAAG